MANRSSHSTFYILHSLLVVAVIASLFFTAVPVASAAGGVKIDPAYHPTNAPTITGEAPKSEIEKSLTVEETRVQFFARIVSVLLGIVGIIAVFALISNAWWLAASAGQEEALTQRKKGLKWAIIGLILVILSYSIIRWIISIPFQADEAPPPPSPATLDKMSVPTGPLDGSAPAPSTEELKQMNKDEYFQKPEDDYSLTDKQFEGAPPEGTKSEGLLESESKQYQEIEKLKSEMEQDKIFKKIDVPEGNFSLDDSQSGQSGLGVGGLQKNPSN